MLANAREAGPCINPEAPYKTRPGRDRFQPTISNPPLLRTLFARRSKNAALDFDAVQRGDAEMENRMNRLMRACIELGERNPIISVHDQGAGGNGNVLKEIVEPAGAEYDIRKVYVGDKTMSVMEIFGAEYQENNALLIKPESEALFKSMADR